MNNGMRFLGMGRTKLNCGWMKKLELVWNMGQDVFSPNDFWVRIDPRDDNFAVQGDYDNISQVCRDGSEIFSNAI